MVELESSNTGMQEILHLTLTFKLYNYVQTAVNETWGSKSHLHINELLIP